MAEPKRPLAPWIVALFTFLGVILVAGAVSMALIGNAPDAVARMQKVSEGAGKLGVVLAIGAYFAQRSRVRSWERKSDPRAKP